MQPAAFLCRFRKFRIRRHFDAFREHPRNVPRIVERKKSYELMDRLKNGPYWHVSRDIEFMNA